MDQLLNALAVFLDDNGGIKSEDDCTKFCK